MLILYTLTIFAGAALLFLVQPMAAKLMLPMLGGSPAVWNASMVFFQAALLAGYLYAHLLSKARSPRVQAGVHAALLLAPLLAFPIPDPRLWAGPGEGSPIPWLLGALAVCVGAPFFVLSTTGPLLQRWFSETAHARARDPYFLYAASNAGSMLALFSYPALVEPAFSLSQQRTLIAAGYVVYALLVLACAASLVTRRRALPEELSRAQRRERQRREDVPTTIPDGPTLAPAVAPSWRTRAMWVFLAFVPSSLSLGVTQHLSTDIASVPLLWVLPLGVYLLTFVLAFSGRPGLTPAKASRILPWLILLVLFVTLAEVHQPMWALIGLHLLTLFMGAMLCHGRLSDTRPAPDRLTEFYLLIAVGGVFGGMFNSIISPVVFAAIVEYPVALVLTLLCVIPSTTTRFHRWIERAITIAIPIVVLTAYLYTEVLVHRVLRIEGGLIYPLLCLGPALGLCALVKNRRGAFAAGIGALFLAQAAMLGAPQRVLYRERTFFGLHRVDTSPRDHIRVLAHGTTRHGMQIRVPEHLRRVPTSYFHPTGPLGDVFRAVQDRAGFDSVAIVGLGAGSMAAYGRAGENFTFYEIDPAVVRIARDLEYFTFLDDSAAKIGMVLGDARLRMASAPDGAYDLIILDAFSSDAIPVHLLTLEAAALYERKLAAGGVMAFHISNRYLELSPVLLGIADRLGLVTLIRDEPDYDVLPEHQAEGKTGSTWVVLCRNLADAGSLAGAENWLRGQARRDTPVWTDDYSNILSVFFWR